MRTVKLLIIGHSFAYEMECVLRLFHPGAKVEVIRDGEASDIEGDKVLTQIAEDNSGIILSAELHVEGLTSRLTETLPADGPEADRERTLGILLFRLLCEKTGIRPPWGALTGVRPSRLARRMAVRGLLEGEISRAFIEDYLALPDKAELALEVARNQRRILADNAPGDFDLYVSIPFCPSRCLYCSFVSHEIEKCAKLIPEYVNRLCRELTETAKLAAGKNLRLRSIYIGGGTPTVLEAGDLTRIMRTIAECFDLSGLIEYTVEAGRPDTVTREKLAAIKAGGADRISVNPQTMDDDVLRLISRKHTAAQTEASFALAREVGCGLINMDLIAGLPGDTDAGFRSTLERVLAMRPENITVHTLTVKRSSYLRGTDGAFDEPEMDMEAAVNTARGMLGAAGYAPYYLYRQKGTKGNLENVGYALPGKESAYNVTVMEETRTVLAVGAGAVTKICGNAGEDISRVYNFKYPYEYIARFDEVLSRKKDSSFPASGGDG
jgi:oxygen-independent coproporphyrinogen-3 oxidase